MTSILINYNEYFFNFIIFMNSSILSCRKIKYD